MNIPVQKDKIAIVVVGYNRLKSLNRLLCSLVDAHYGSIDIPLVISIDCSGDTELYRFVQAFHWPHGEKYVNIQEKRLGLKAHIYQCGDLTKYFKGIILLEDDLFVSPYFYQYVCQVLSKYGDDERIAQISLYKNETNGYVGFPFDVVQNGSDVFLMQATSTWGQCWNEKMWTAFTEWRDQCCTEALITGLDMPDIIKRWERAWSKYFNSYIVAKDKYVVYPNVSLTTNFSDAGEHGDTNNSIVQVNLLQGSKEYYLKPLEELERYNIWGCNENIYQWLGLKKEECCLDVYGFRDIASCDKKYIVSTKVLGYPVKHSFALNMRPIELNIKYNIKGDGIFVYEREEGKASTTSRYTDDIIPYFLRGIRITLLLRHVLICCKNRMLKYVSKKNT